MKHVALIGLLALASGIPLESQALTFAGGQGMGMHNSMAMAGIATGIGASAANAGAAVAGAGAGSARVMAVGNGAGNFSLTIPNISFPNFTGLTLPEITFPNIAISSFPNVTLPSSSGSAGNELQQTGTGNMASQVNNHSTSIVQQGNGAGPSAVIINNADKNQVKQNSVS